MSGAERIKSKLDAPSIKLKHLQFLTFHLLKECISFLPDASMIAVIFPRKFEGILEND